MHLDETGAQFSGLLQPHHGKSPMECYFQLSDDIPYSDEVYELYEPSLE